METFKIILFIIGFLISIFKIYKIYKLKEDLIQKKQIKYYFILSLLFICLIIDKI